MLGLILDYGFSILISPSSHIEHFVAPSSPNAVLCPWTLAPTPVQASYLILPHLGDPVKSLGNTMSRRFWLKFPIHLELEESLE